MSNKEEKAVKEEDCLRLVSSFLIPFDRIFMNLHCAFDPILLTLKEESIEGLIPKLKRSRLV